MWQQSPALVTMHEQLLFYNEPNPSNIQLLETVKFFDGFFVGNAYASQQTQFLGNNKIGLIVNCNPSELKLLQNPNPPRILTYNFHTKRGELQQHLNINPLIQIFTQIDVYLTQKHQGVLIVSKGIDSKCIVMVCAYIMIKFGWQVQKTISFVGGRNQKIKIGDKFLQILRKLDGNCNKNKLVQIFQSNRTQEEQQLLKNTIKNSQVINLPNFHGLNYQKHQQKQQTNPSLSKPQPTTIKFIQKVEYIDHLNQVFDLSIDLDANPYIQQQNPSNVKNTNKLTTVQKKLKNFIKQKCQTQTNSEPGISIVSIAGKHSNFKGEGLPFKTNQITRRLPRRRAMSKTEQSQPSEHFKIKVKTNNFTTVNQPPSRSNHSDLDKRLQSSKKQFLEQHSQDLKPKKIYPVKPFIQSKRCHTQSSHHTDLSAQQPKQNPMFKISKSNKNSHKKLKNDHGTFTRAKISSYMPAKSSQNSISSLNSDLKYSLTNFRIDKTLNEKLEKISKGGDRVVNLNLNVQIENINLIHSNTDFDETDRRNTSSKFKNKYHTKSAHSKK